MASYTQNQTYRVSLTLASPSGKVLDAPGDCKASAMGRCNYIAALYLRYKIIHYSLDIRHWMLIPANCVLGMLARNQNNNHSHVILLFTVKNVKLTDSVIIVLWDPLFKWMILNLLMNLYQLCLIKFLKLTIGICC